MLRHIGACMSATLSAKSLVVHDAACWSDHDAKWDAEPLDDAAVANPAHKRHWCESGVQCTPSRDFPLLGSRETRSYDFHSRNGPLPEPLRLHSKNLQEPSDTAGLDLS